MNDPLLRGSLETGIIEDDVSHTKSLPFGNPFNIHSIAVRRLPLKPPVLYFYEYWICFDFERGRLNRHALPGCHNSRPNAYHYPRAAGPAGE